MNTNSKIVMAVIVGVALGAVARVRRLRADAAFALGPADKADIPRLRMSAEIRPSGDDRSR
jgi:hypothetical protein